MCALAHRAPTVSGPWWDLPVPVALVALSPRWTALRLCSDAASSSGKPQPHPHQDRGD